MALVPVLISGEIDIFFKKWKQLYSCISANSSEHRLAPFFIVCEDHPEGESPWSAQVAPTCERPPLATGAGLTLPCCQPRMKTCVFCEHKQGKAEVVGSFFIPLLEASVALAPTFPAGVAIHNWMKFP